MEPIRIRELAEIYRHTLLDDVIPFWMGHSLDTTHGGYLTCLDRQGQVYDTDKQIWMQGRQVWMLSRLYAEVEPRQEWLDAARLGIDFVDRYGYDADGRMFFLVTRDGRPLRKRRYLFSETFAIIAGARFAQITGEERHLQRAMDTYRMVVDLFQDPSRRPELAPTVAPKANPEVRVARDHAVSMILIATSQELREVTSDPACDEVIDWAIDNILRLHVHRDERALFEVVGPRGERLDSPAGRLITPGHAMESAWFIMREGLRRGDRGLIDDAAEVLEWSLEWGWDPEFGGLLYFVDAEGRPPAPLEWDMKLWWPHTEALYCTLLAHHLTGEPHWADWYERLHEWSFSRFADPEHGEWFGYLHRDGTVANPLKGSHWKGCFHLPRALLYGWQLLQEMAAATPAMPAQGGGA